jgi:hypothetical protein
MQTSIRRCSRFFPLATRKIPGFSLDTHEQLLYVGAGVLLILRS